jgi:hypothetical protein
VHVDEAGGDVAALGVDDQRGAGPVQVAPDLVDHAVLDDDVHAHLKCCEINETTC